MTSNDELSGREFERRSSVFVQIQRQTLSSGVRGNMKSFLCTNPCLTDETCDDFL